MNVRKTLLVISIVAATAGSIWFYFSPYLALQQLKTAAQNSDTEELTELVDFPAVRESVKEALKASVMREMKKMEDNPFAALGMLMADAMIDPMVESFVSPNGIAALSEGQRPAKGNMSATDENFGKVPSQPIQAENSGADVLMGYEGLSKFTVRFREKESGKDEIILVMKRSGLSWKLTSIRMPILLKP